MGVDSDDYSGRFGTRGAPAGIACIETRLPPYSRKSGDQPIYCFNKGACWNISGYLHRPDPSWYQRVKAVDQIINLKKPEGIQVYRRFRPGPLRKTLLSATKTVPPGSLFVDISLSPPMGGNYAALTRANWNTSVIYKVISNTTLRLTFTVPAPEGAKVDWMAGPLATVRELSYRVVRYQSDEVVLPAVPALPMHNVFVSANWGTNVWQDSVSESGAVTVRFSNPAPFQANLAILRIRPEKSGIVPVPATVSSIIVPIENRREYQAVALPHWNTGVEIEKNENFLVLSFNTPPAVDGFVSWGIN